MKAYININQQAFNQLSQIKKIKIDLIDATIFEFIYKFSISNKANKKLIDNKLYIWCSYQKIIDDNPLLNISTKKAIEIRLNKLCKLGILSKFTDKKLGNKTYFNVTDLAYSLLIENTNISNENYQGLVTKITKVSNEDYQGVSNEDYYNSKLVDSKLIEKEKIYKKETSIINRIIDWIELARSEISPTQEQESTFKTFIDYWTAHNSNDKKFKAEKEKSFYFKQRFSTFMNNSFKNNIHNINKSNTTTVEELIADGIL